MNSKWWPVRKRQIQYAVGLILACIISWWIDRATNNSTFYLGFFAVVWIFSLNILSWHLIKDINCPLCGEKFFLAADSGRVFFVRCRSCGTRVGGTMNLRRLITEELLKFRKKSYTDLRELVLKKHVDGYDIEVESKKYDIEIQYFWDGKPEGNIRVIGAINERGTFGSFRPVCDDFIMAPDGTFVGE